MYQGIPFLLLFMFNSNLVLVAMVHGPAQSVTSGPSGKGAALITDTQGSHSELELGHGQQNSYKQSDSWC